MLVVISDLHFEEEESDFLADGVSESPHFSRALFRRNTPAEAYRRLIAWLAHEAHRSGAKRMDLVLAGDILDLHRTTLWFTDNSDGARPYVGSSERIDGVLEAKIQAILTAIAVEEEVEDSLKIFQLLANGYYRESPDGPEQAFPADEVTLHYIPGNHDRLANASPPNSVPSPKLTGVRGRRRVFSARPILRRPRSLRSPWARV